jgi:aspartate oxidase
MTVVAMRTSLVKISSRAGILATGGVKGVYDFTDTPANLVGDGQSMALEVGAELVEALQNKRSRSTVHCTKTISAN